jgi:hypothetical protein
MPTPLLTRLQKAYVRVFKTMCRLYFGEDAVLNFLREDAGDGGSVPFESLLVLPDKWDAKFSEFFGTTTFRIADLTAEFAAIVANSTHLMITGSSNAALNNMLYEFLPETQPPLQKDAFWKIRTKSLGRRYFAPVEE